MECNSCLSDRLFEIASKIHGKRIARIKVDGTAYWIKYREEIKSLRHKALKGNASESFEREVIMLDNFSKLGVPVPKIMARSKSFVVLSDQGQDLTHVLEVKKNSETVLRSVGQAIASLHAHGLSHGRPCLRDICWDGQKITFLDLEAGASLNATPHRQARDILLFLHSLLTEYPLIGNQAFLFLDEYAKTDEKNIIPKAMTLANRLILLEWIVAPIVWRHKKRNKPKSEFFAIAATRTALRRYKASTNINPPNS